MARDCTAHPKRQPNRGTTVSLDFPVDAEAATTQRYMPETPRVAERLAG